MRVDSVTSTCLRSSFGDMTTFSAPMVPGSSGTWPGQMGNTCGAPSARTIAPKHSNEAKNIVVRSIIAPADLTERFARMLTSETFFHKTRCALVEQNVEPKFNT